MKPFNPTPQELLNQYMEVNFTDEGKPWIVEGKHSVFTLGDLVNGLHGLSVNQLEKARTIKTGKIKKITHSYKPRHVFGLYRVDPIIESAIIQIEQQRTSLKAQIDQQVGLLVAQRENLLDQIKHLKAKRLK